VPVGRVPTLHRLFVFCLTCSLHGARLLGPAHLSRMYCVCCLGHHKDGPWTFLLQVLVRGILLTEAVYGSALKELVLCRAGPHLPGGQRDWVLLGLVREGCPSPAVPTCQRCWTSVKPPKPSIEVPNQSQSYSCCSSVFRCPSTWLDWPSSLSSVNMVT
jgi:hypothetical protein